MEAKLVHLREARAADALLGRGFVDGKAAEPPHSKVSAAGSRGRGELR